MMEAENILKIAHKAAQAVNAPMDYEDRVQDACLALCGAKPSWVRACGQIKDSANLMHPGYRKGRELPVADTGGSVPDRACVEYDPARLVEDADSVGYILRRVPRSIRRAVWMKANGYSLIDSAALDGVCERRLFELIAQARQNLAQCGYA